MKIAIITNTFYPEINGVVTFLLNISRGLAEKGHKIIIYTTKKHKKIDLGRNIKIEYYPCTNLFTKYPEFEIEKFSIGFLGSLKKFNPDVIHISTPTMFGWESLFYAWIFRKPIVAVYHTFLPGFKEHLKMKILSNAYLIDEYTRTFYNKADIVIAPSKIIRDFLIKGKLVKKKSKIKIISHGVKTAIFRKAGFNDNPVILYVGRLSYEKDLDVAIRAFKELEKNSKNATFLVVGDGPDKEKLENLAKSPNIRFLGALRGKKLIDAYSKADIFLTASPIETEGITVLEAMSSGLPIVGVRKLALAGLVKNNGFLARPRDFVMISRYLEKLVKDKNLRKKMGGESLRLCRDYDIGNTVRRLERVYERLIASKP